MNTGQPGVFTFLIADIRGYSRYTDEFGAEAAAGLTTQFVQVVTENVEMHGGKVVEIRGDEALAVFTSARQAIRCAVDLQARFDEEADLDHDLPLRVGIGIDSGESVALEDGSFRGAALNVAARLCGRAHGGDVILTEATYRLAGRMEGLTFSDRGRVHLKNITDPIHILQAYSEQDAPAANRWVPTFFGRADRQLGLRLAVGVVGLAALTAAGVVYLTAGDDTEGSNCSGCRLGRVGRNPDAGRERRARRDRPTGPLEGLPGAEHRRAVGRRDGGVPARERDARSVGDLHVPRCGLAQGRTYASELRRREEVPRGKGKCNAFSWGGERPWLHGPDKPGGRVFCYFDGNDAVIVWTHERLGQPTHRDILVRPARAAATTRGSRAGGAPGTTRSARRSDSYSARPGGYASFTQTCLTRVYSSIE